MYESHINIQWNHPFCASRALCTHISILKCLKDSRRRFLLCCVVFFLPRYFRLKNTHNWQKKRVTETRARTSTHIYLYIPFFVYNYIRKYRINESVNRHHYIDNTNDSTITTTSNPYCNITACLLTVVAVAAAADIVTATLLAATAFR